MHCGEYILAEMEERGMSVAELAKAVGEEEHYIKDILTLQYQAPITHALLSKIAEALMVTPQFLINLDKACWDKKKSMIYDI